jgi:phosphonatase-like hydrolase
MIQLAIFDMAGTTVRDLKEVETCFAQAARQTGLDVSDERITAVQGWSKRYVFETLWTEQLGANAPTLPQHVETSYGLFKSILEAHYRTQPVVPTEGCLETFAYLKAQGIPIALTTGFYRKVVAIILERLGWNEGLDEHYAGSSSSLIQLSIAGDEVTNGRPAPDMIQRAMQHFGITDARQVVNVGDTPSDLESGRRAGVGLNLGVTNGTHTYAQLAAFPQDGLLPNLGALPQLLASGAIRG